MPRGIIDSDKLEHSEKLAKLSPEIGCWYPWLICRRDANGVFEIPANFCPVPHLWRNKVTRKKIEDCIRKCGAIGLLFVWQFRGKTYAYVMGSDAPGLLPNPSHRNRYGAIDVRIPRKELAAYRARFSYACPQIRRDAGQHPDSVRTRSGQGIGSGRGEGTNGTERQKQNKSEKQKPIRRLRARDIERVARHTLRNLQSATGHRRGQRLHSGARGLDASESSIGFHGNSAGPQIELPADAGRDTRISGDCEGTESATTDKRARELSLLRGNGDGDHCVAGRSYSDSVPESDELKVAKAEFLRVLQEVAGKRAMPYAGTGRDMTDEEAAKVRDEQKRALEERRGAREKTTA